MQNRERTGVPAWGGGSDRMLHHKPGHWSAPSHAECRHPVATARGSARVPSQFALMGSRLSRSKLGPPRPAWFVNEETIEEDCSERDR